MSKVTERANELYPNNKTFCGGVASIARDAYLKGCEETRDNIVDAAIIVYEEWMGGTMENVRKAMNTLGELVEPIRKSR